MGQRIGPDGLPAEDVLVNPKYLERIGRETKERQKLESEAAEPWSRAKLERELARLSTQKPSYVIDGVEIKSGLDLHGADLSGLDLSGLDLSRSNMHGAKLAGSNLANCRLVGTNLHGADLSGTDMSGVNAVEANLHGACLCDANVSKTHFMKANLAEACHEDVSGLDIVEKPMTPAETAQARHRQSEGFRVNVSTDDGTVRYFGDTLSGANVAGMSRVHKKRP